MFASWFGKRANDYRNSQKIAHDLGTAVNVVTMVFGNMGDDSGTGVAFTRNPNTGEELYGEYLTNAQGEDVVAGIRTAAEDQPARRPTCPAVYDEFDRIGHQLESALPQRPGPRVHDRARPAVHAPDPRSPSGPPRRP